MVMEGWSLWWYKLMQVPIQEQSMLPYLSMGSLLILSAVAIIGNQLVGRHHSPTASWMQDCAAQSIPIPVLSQEHLQTSPGVKGQTPTCSLVRYGSSEATSVKQLQWNSLIRCPQSMHRHSYSRDRKQQHQSPP